MKILFPYDIFPGGFLTSISKAFKQLGHEVVTCHKYVPTVTSKVLHRLDHKGYFGIKQRIKQKRVEEFNNLLIELAILHRVDLFFGISGGGYLPSTIKKLQNLGVKTITYVADNPCDPRRDKYYAMSLRYYDIILYADRIWLKIINNLAEKSKKIKFSGGYDPEIFHLNLNFPKQKIDELTHEVVFTGGSYNETAEGSYRAGILGQLAEDGYDIRIWGDKGWIFREQFYPALKGKIITNRLPYVDLLALFKYSKVYLNMPSPQIFTSFQPRVFEIAAAKGFQIIDHSDELDDIFGKNYVSFKNYQDLKNKLDFFLKNPEEREQYVNSMHSIVESNYTWVRQIEKVINQI